MSGEVFTETELLEWVGLIAGHGPVSVFAIAAAKPWAFERVEAEVQRLAREGKLQPHPGAVDHAIHGRLTGYTLPSFYLLAEETHRRMVEALGADAEGMTDAEILVECVRRFPDGLPD